MLKFKIKASNSSKYMDKFATYFISISGLSVIFVIIFIFVYLFYEVVPIFYSSEITLKNKINPDLIEQGKQKTLLIHIEEENQIYARLDSKGVIYFHKIENGYLVKKSSLPVSSEILTVSSLFYEGKNMFALGTKNGNILIVDLKYSLNYSEDLKKNITPNIDFPYGDIPFQVTDVPIQKIGFYTDEEEISHIAAYTKEGEVFFVNFIKKEDFLGEVIYDVEKKRFKDFIKLNSILINDRWIYLVLEKSVQVFDLKSEKKNAQQEIQFSDVITEAKFLLGSNSLLLGTNTGSIFQLFMVLKENNYLLKKVRSFKESNFPIQLIISESRRKGFVSMDQHGTLDFFHTTSENHLLQYHLKNQKNCFMSLSPDMELLAIESCKGSLSFWNIDNFYTDISWKVLWKEIWYENYQEPAYVWQSSSASNDFEPKYSLTPLLFGTFKATLYSVLFAAPLAILGAMYTGFFVTSSMRKFIKPLVELMQAFPTVILGFLAGLFFAPIFEKILLDILLSLFFLPIGVILFSVIIHCLEHPWKRKYIHGFEFLWIIPLLLGIIYFSSKLSTVLEVKFFNGNFKIFLTDILNINYDQRNALVVSFIMGLAVIPIIFSITEDAIFNVPKSLVNGALALGSNYWQTLIKVVFPTAAPSLFSAVMIGIGRAFGETMIILMATGNTPIMDMNVFEGMRTFAANLAVELPETEIGSSHYRILFITALVLFIFSFIFNTIAENISTRLRKKYSEL